MQHILDQLEKKRELARLGGEPLQRGDAMARLHLHRLRLDR